MKWATFIQVNFDKLLLTVMWVVQLVVVVCLVTTKDTGSISWGRELTGTVVGALIGIITGANLQRVNGVPTNTTNTTSTTTTNSSHEDTL